MPPSYLPAILGAVLAWSFTGKFHSFYFLITVVAVTINHIALNMTDDYFDYQHSVDQAREREKNPYSGGSGTLTSHLITPKRMVTAFTIGYAVTILLGLYLTVNRGWQVFLFGTFGIFCAYFYTAPPIRYGYRGFGELSQLINFSLTIGLGSYFVQAQQLSREAALTLLPLGFMMFAMITINEIPDERTDRQGGKMNLVVRFGAKTAVYLYGTSMLTAFAIIFTSPLFGLATFWIYMSLVTFPWFVKAFYTLLKYYRDPFRMSPANMMTIRIHNLTGILLIIASTIEGTCRHGDFRPMIIPLLLLSLLYLPVILTVFFNLMPLKTGEPYSGDPPRTA